MFTKRHVFISLATIMLIASILACNAPTRSTPKPPPDTVTPYVPATAQSQDVQPSKAPDEAQPTQESPAETEAPTPSEVPATSTSAPTPIPTQPVSEGPLDFEEPRWVESWAPSGDGGILVTIKVKIVGGAPPFTIKHEGNVVGTTWEREYNVEFPWAGCKPIARNITVESADGQSASKNYWISTDVMGWCD
jgi:hypothetical protein